MGDKVKVSVLETNGVEELEVPCERSLTADIVEFNPVLGIYDDVDTWARSIGAAISDSASPGFNWGNSGASNAGQYLRNNNVFSNSVGRLVPFAAFVAELYFIELNATGTRTLELVSRATPGSGAFTAIAEVEATGTDTFSRVSFPSSGVGSVLIAADSELAMRVKSTSAQVKDVVATAIIKTQ